MPSVTQAFVLGAGLGTRLRPLTDDLPKPLVPIFQKPLITFAFDHLIDFGVTKLLVNTHHRPEKFRAAFRDSKYRDVCIEFHHEPDLLETAGGIANIADSVGNEPLLVYNADILTDLPLAPLLDCHFRGENLVTLVLRSGNGPKHIAFDSAQSRILDIRNQLQTGAPETFVFSGVYLIDRKFVDFLNRGVKRSVIPVFLELIKRGEKIGGVVIDEGRWWDVGNRSAYLELHKELLALKFPNYPLAEPDWKTLIHASATIDPTAALSGCTVVGRGCRIGPEAVVRDTILWEGSQIASRSLLAGCIVRAHRNVNGTHRNVDI